MHVTACNTCFWPHLGWCVVILPFCQQILLVGWGLPSPPKKELLEIPKVLTGASIET